MSGSYLSRLDILNAQDFQTKEITVPEWGGNILVRGLSAGEVDDLGFDALDDSGEFDAKLTRHMRIRIVALCTIKKDGEQVFKEKDVRDLARKSHSAIDRVATAVMELTGLTGGAEDEEKNG